MRLCPMSAAHWEITVLTKDLRSKDQTNSFKKSRKGLFITFYAQSPA